MSIIGILMGKNLLKKRERCILVPIETGFGNAPDLMKRGIVADIGAVAEALIYYDTVIINVAHSEHFHELFEWFKISDSPQSLLNMMKSGEVFFHHYNFSVNPIYIPQEGRYLFYNVDEPKGDRLQLFRHRVVKSISRYFNTYRKRKAFFDSLDDSVITVEADTFGSAVKDSHKYIADEGNFIFLLRCIFNSLKNAKFIENIPDIHLVSKSVSNGRIKMEVSIDLRQYSKIIGKEFNFGEHTPFAMVTSTNRLIWSAAMQHSDLYLNNPTFEFLYERMHSAVKHFGDTKLSLRKLNMEVDFPDIRGEVNRGIITAKDVLKIREKSQEFREWLHKQTELDRDLLSSYHNTILEKSGLSGSMKKILKCALFVVINAAGVAVGDTIGGAKGTAYGIGISAMSPFLNEIYNHLLKGWSPKIFTADMKRIIQ